MDETLLNNRYRLIELIGAGGMAVVYKGLDILLHRPVAVKILREAYSSDPSFLSRFQQEARAAAQLDHSNVVTIYDVGQDRGRHYIVMEYVPGEDLKTLIRREGRFSVERAIDVAMQVASGVGHAHKAGIIHCDIKPQNVLVTTEGVAKVTDFGIARALSESGLTDSEVVWGSPIYFSPEQAAGERPTPASDVYSIGVMLYEMLAGQPPFQAEKPTALALMHMREEPPPLMTRNPRVPPQLEWIVRKLLAKEPAARYRTAEQLVYVLQQYCSRGNEATGFYPLEASPAQSRKDARSAAPAEGPAEGGGPDWRTWILGAVATVAVIGLLPLWALVYRAWTHSSAMPTPPPLSTPTPTVVTVLVPNVQGQPWEMASGALEGLGLRYTLEEQVGAAAPEGTVVRQEPPAGQSVVTGSEVWLYIAGPPATVEVPLVTDAPIDVARALLEQQSLHPVEETVWSERPVGTVIDQQPAEGIQVQAGDVVTLTISGGTAVPIEIQANLGNMILLEKVELLQARFRPGEVLSVSIRWQATTALSTRYVVFVHLIGPSGNLVAQEDVEPLQGTRPTDGWTPGVGLWDPHQVRIPADVQSGVYQLRCGMYAGGQPGVRLSVVDPGETTVESDSILLAEIQIAP